MSYTPTSWNTGDTITAAAMNKIENGIANAGGATIITDTSGTLDKTFAEIYNLIAGGTPCYIMYKNVTPSDLDEEYTYTVVLLPIVKVRKYDDMYRVYATNSSQLQVNSYPGSGTPQVWSYSATNASSYPTFYRSITVATAYVTASGNDA